MASGLPGRLDRGGGLLRGRRPMVLAAGLALSVAGVLAAVFVDGAVVVRLAGGLAAVTGLPAAITWLLAGDVAELRTATSRAAAVAERTDLVARIDVFEQVLADATRRPWSPTLMPWDQARRPERPVVLLPGGDYHLPEVVELADHLDRRGVPSLLAAGDAHWPRLAQGLAGWPGVEVLRLPAPEALVEARPRAVLTMADWGAFRPYVIAANHAGIPTFAKVEGACDYDDVDVGAGARHPYRTAQTILCQGENDRAALPGDTAVVGSTRLERLWWSPTSGRDRDLVVINLNFTYGVLTSERQTFLESAVEACESAGRPYVISLHPAERARDVHPRAVSIGISPLLERATCLVSRFSTAPFEAMARGVPFVYHNPHGEKVSTFRDARGAFEVTTSSAELCAALERPDEPGLTVRARTAAFFGQQVDIHPTLTSAERATDVIVARLGS